MSVLATDNFNRADQNPLATNWTDAGDTSPLKLLTNQIVPSNVSNDCSAFYNAVAFPNDQYSQITMASAESGGGGQGGGPGVRMATSKNYYRLVGDKAASTNWELAKKVAGTYTQIGTATQSWSDGDTIYIEIKGTQIVTKKNGTGFGSWATDSSLANGKAGITYSSTSSTWACDNWEGGDFAVAGGPPYSPWLQRGPVMAQ